MEEDDVGDENARSIGGKRKSDVCSKPRKVLCQHNATVGHSTSAEVVTIDDKSRFEAAEDVLPSKPMNWQGTDCPTVREILLYAALESLESKSPYSPKQASAALYKDACSLVNQLVPSCDRVCPMQLRSYFLKANQTKARVGKYRGKVRWGRFKSLTLSVTDKYAKYLSCSQEIECSIRVEIGQHVKECIQEWSKPSNPSWDVSSLMAAISTRPKWQVVDEIQGSNLVTLDYYGSTSFPIRSVAVNATTLEYELFVFKKPTTMAHSSTTLPQALLSQERVGLLLSAVESAVICAGCSMSKYKDICDKHNGLFMGRDGSVVAKLDDSWVPGRAIRSVACSYFVENGRTCCEGCKLFSGTLRSALSRLNNHEGPSSKHTPFINLSKDELVSRLRSEVSKNNALRKQNERLAAAREKLEKVSNNEDFLQLFKDLESGISQVHSRVTNPQCRWIDCSSNFDTVDALVAHVNAKHVHTTKESSQLHPEYKCSWTGCSHAAFGNRKRFQTHILRHTGTPEDVHFSILLKDQAKALTLPPEQMRWHPMVLRWCLQQFSRSSKGYEALRGSGFLRLPSGRTLLRYRSFSHPETGWNDPQLSAMRDVYNYFIQASRGLSDRSFIGALVFDEMKIKEGLVWDIKTNDLVGFVDLGDSGDPVGETTMEDSTQDLATHVLQFSFKSLFSTFSHPCAFFFTKKLTYLEIDRLFWEGVLRLHDHGFRVLMAICDGASPNRKFIEHNIASSNSPQATNPVDKWPIFFISDPTHVIKKLRNNLLRSGYHQACTKLLKLKGKVMLWKYIRDVFDRDSARKLRYTSLRQEHISLSSLSMMRSRLAYDIFNKRVEAEMAECAEEETASLRLLLSCVRDFASAFSSSEKIEGSFHTTCSSLKSVLEFMLAWKQECDSLPTKQEQAKSFLSYQVFQDLSIAINGILSLVKFMETNDRVKDLRLYIKLCRLNQDFLENYFGLQRSIGGCSQNMTAHRYGYQALALQQTHIIPQNLKSAALELPLPKGK